MRRLIEAFIAKHLCCHEWDLHRQINVFQTEESEKPHTTKEILICKKCGKIKTLQL